MDERIAERWRGHVPGPMGAEYRCGVLVPLVSTGDGPSLVYEVRARTLRRQPGEVCFPGGRLERGETPVQGALREAREELGIPPGSVEVVGEMDFIVHQSGFVLYPVIGLVEGWTPETARLNGDEVERIFTVPLAVLAANPPQVWRCPLVPQIPSGFPTGQVGIGRDYPWRGGWMEVPVYPCTRPAIWGLTARITQKLVEGP